MIQNSLISLQFIINKFRAKTHVILSEIYCICLNKISAKQTNLKQFWTILADDVYLIRTGNDIAKPYEDRLSTFSISQAANRESFK